MKRKLSLLLLLSVAFASQVSAKGYFDHDGTPKGIENALARVAEAGGKAVLNENSRLYWEDNQTDPGTGTEDPGTGTEDPGTGTEDPGTGTEDPGTGTEDPGTGTPTDPGTGTEPAPDTGTTDPIIIDEPTVIVA